MLLNCPVRRMKAAYRTLPDRRRLSLVVDVIGGPLASVVNFAHKTEENIH